MSWAAVLLAAALLLGGRPTRAHVRAADDTRAKDSAPRDADALAVASTFDVFAACLNSGMAVSTAAAAAASSAPAALAGVLTRAADMLALGADPAAAWTNPALPLDSQGEALLRLARRSAASGSALAQGVADLADQSRSQAAAAAESRAQRASVLIAGPLGVCYLPAFVCLGIVPIVAGLAGDVLRSGLS
ncbi:pilus assembly protein TadC [Mycolicibacterium agri]|uniref:Pilus assembly protein TadC n=1 Tax=Mycolicibacterium agri TaxID=36811 RepID=A0A2A7NG66_MYCAG|nr:type II secretion system F family protein [Mycolicibacterium agri]PEG43035.1 pilus assembly protein TadC [Mycolicibacterium agri]GFG54597.1 type II secretion system protein F [Mycolicibacterium agri]